MIRTSRCEKNACANRYLSRFDQNIDLTHATFAFIRSVFSSASTNSGYCVQFFLNDFYINFQLTVTIETCAKLDGVISSFI